MKRIELAMSLLLLFAVNSVNAQQKFEHTLEFDSVTMTSPPQNLNVLHWLAGHWKGEAFGGIGEEIWSPPLGGSMMCMYKMVSAKNQVVFYELISIAEHQNTLIKRLRHFNNNLTGWEDKKGKPLTFRFIKAEGDRVYFDGFTYEKVSDDEINIYAILQQKNGVKEEVKFNYKRVK